MILGEHEEVCDLPEYAHICDTPENIVFWNKRARGFGGSPEDDYSASCGEENVLALPSDRYAGENILIHEFAHLIHTVGIVGVDPHFDKQLEGLLQNAIKQGLWQNTYASLTKKNILQNVFSLSSIAIATQIRLTGFIIPSTAEAN